MTLVVPISVAWSAERASREGASYGKEGHADRRRRRQNDGAFAAVLAQAMRRRTEP